MGRAIPVEALISGLTDSVGSPLALGKIYTYAAGTTTPKSVWQDNAQASAHANPVVLDSQGKKLVYAEGNYRFVIKDSNDNTLYTHDNLWFSSDDAGLINVGTTGGSANAQTGSTSVDIGSTIPTGTIVRGIAGYTNSGAMTFNLNGDGAVAVRTKRSSSVELGSGAIIAGEAFSLYYDGTYWRSMSDREGRKTYTPTYTAQAGTYTSVTTDVASYERIGNEVDLTIRAFGTTSTTPTGLRCTLPYTAADLNDLNTGGWTSDGGTTVGGWVWGISTTVVEMHRYDTAAYSAGANRYMAFTLKYRAVP